MIGGTKGQPLQVDPEKAAITVAEAGNTALPEDRIHTMTRGAPALPALKMECKF